MMYSGDEQYDDEITSGVDLIRDEPLACPNCGSMTGRPVHYDYGIDAETGYHDAGEGCTECMEVQG